MWRLFPRFFSKFKYRKGKNKKLSEAVRNIVGFRPVNIHLYFLASQHTSVAQMNVAGKRDSYERLEFLGDAVLGMVVGEYLFKKYPFKDEGFLTEIRSRIVNRESLNRLAKKVGVNNFVEYNPGGKRHNYKYVFGNSLEALIGAVYLDHGFGRCRHFIIKRLLIPHFDLEKLIKSNTNFKSRVIEWSQKTNTSVDFIVQEIETEGHLKEFKAELIVDGNKMSEGIGNSKKKAEQIAAERAIDSIFDKKD
ncbi:ribonuclease III [Marinigracilibium pacificum]|uniref:ribonuclease III n=1 Tax=Marinigracilibium pacificum TaxID=2729599 RepID=UPI002FE3A794